MGGTLMIFGLGDLGGWALEFFARREGLSKIVTVDVNEDWGVMKTHCATVGAGLEGYSKTIQFEKCDVRETGRTAELIEKHKPDVIYSTLTIAGWLSVRMLPAMHGAKYHKCTVAGFPAQALLLSKLMHAVKMSGVRVHVINHSFPDVVNPVLCRAGFPILVGAGNLDNLVGEIKRKISITENVPYRDVNVYLIAEHALNVLGSRSGTPYFLKIMIGDKNITDRLDVDSLLSDRLMPSPPDKGSWLNHPAIAASAVKNVMAIINDTNESTCAPGPKGLPGGYPIRINSCGVELDLPEGIDPKEAVRINMEGMKKEGVEKIAEDGTVVLTEEASELIKELYGLDWKQIRFAEIEEKAVEITAIQKQLVEKYKGN